MASVSFFFPFLLEKKSWLSFFFLVLSLFLFSSIDGDDIVWIPSLLLWAHFLLGCLSRYRATRVTLPSVTVTLHLGSRHYWHVDHSATRVTWNVDHPHQGEKRSIDPFFSLLSCSSFTKRHGVCDSGQTRCDGVNKERDLSQSRFSSFILWSALSGAPGVTHRGIRPVECHSFLSITRVTHVPVFLFFFFWFDRVVRDRSTIFLFFLF